MLLIEILETVLLMFVATVLQESFPVGLLPIFSENNINIAGISCLELCNFVLFCVVPITGQVGGNLRRILKRGTYVCLSSTKDSPKTTDG